MLSLLEFGGSSSLTIVLLAVSLYLVAWLNRKSKPGVPPVVPYWIPWLGSAISLGKDPDAFFANAREKWGSVFRIKAAGNEMTYVTTSELIQAVYRDPQTFQYLEIRQEMQMKMLQLPYEISYSEELSQSFFPHHHRALTPGNIRGLLQDYTCHAYEELLTRVHSLGSSPDGIPLGELVGPASYCASAKAFYGQSYPAEHTRKHFLQFDGVVHLLAAGVPLWVLPKARRSREVIVEANAEHVGRLRRSEEKLTDYMEMIVAEGDKHGWSDKVVGIILSLSLWALEANTAPALYWVTVFLLQHPIALQSVLAELETARSKWTDAHSGTPLTEANFYDFMQDVSDQLPLLQATIQEGLRLRSSSFSIRRVAVPTELGGYHFNVGDQVICNTRAVHMDEKLADAPTEFIFDRYTEAGKKRAAQSGKTSTLPFLPFGGGVSMCEGRHFAMGAMKTFLAMLFTFYTVELHPTSQGCIPEANLDRIGLGVVGAKRDVKVVIERKHS